eukprot:2121474-Rhodomonas_salina.2
MSQSSTSNVNGIHERRTNWDLVGRCWRAGALVGVSDETTASQYKFGHVSFKTGCATEIWTRTIATIHALAAATVQIK